MSQQSVEELLAGLQTPKDGKVLFEDYLQDAWKLFQFPGDPNLPGLEAFLINAVFNKFKNAEHNRNEAISRDACLVGLGLLAGCYHTETKDGVPTHCVLKVRYTSYLRGDYIKLQYPNPQEGDNLDIADKDSLPQGAFERSVERGLEKLAGTLKSMIGGASGSCQDCLWAGIEKYTELIMVSNGNEKQEVRRVILPQPCYTLKNFAPKSKKKSTKPTQRIVTEPIKSTESTLAPSIEPTREPVPELIPEPTQGTTGSGSSEPPSGSTSDLPPNMTTEPVSGSTPEPPVDTGSDIAGSKEPSKKDHPLKLVIWIIGLAILFITVVGTILLLFTNTLAENRGQFEVHTSSCYMRLDFSPQDYDKPSSSEMIFNEEFRDSQD